MFSYMAFFIPILITLLVSLLGGLYLLGTFRRRRPNEPPLDKGKIPWLGYALDFRHNAATFLQKMQKKHGDIFTVQIGGYFYTFLMDPLSFGAVTKEATSKLDFEKFAKELCARVFGYHSEINDQKLMQIYSIKNLMGDGLVTMTKVMMGNLQNLLLHRVGSGGKDKTWKQDGLFHFSYSIIFRAGYLALFGNEAAKEAGSREKAKENDQTQSEELFQEFRKFNYLFPCLVHSVLSPREKMEADRLKRLFWSKLSVKNILSKDNVSAWISDQQQFRKEIGMEEYMQDRFMLLLLWASQGNTGYASFWLLLYLMKDPEAMKAVREEIYQVIQASGQEVKPGGQLLNLTRDMLLKTPVLDSAVEESLRLTAAPILIRAVLQDMNLKMADGKKYALRKGDRVAIFPYIAVQMDPEVHPEPHVFKYNRFLPAEGTKKVHFYKNGKKVKYFTMPWGAGTTICPGRFFAINELKQFVFLMLSYFEFELVNPGEDIPALDPIRWGLGAMQPAHDIPFRYRLRF